MVKIAGTSHFFFFSVASCDLEAGIRMALLIRGCGLSILGNYCTSVTHLQISAATPPSASKLLKIESLTNKLLTVGGFLRRLGKRLDKFDRHFAEDTKCYNPRTRRKPKIFDKSQTIRYCTNPFTTSAIFTCLMQAS